MLYCFSEIRFSRPISRLIVMLVAFALLPFFSLAAELSEQTSAELQIRVGLAGTYKVGCWTEIRLDAGSLEAGKIYIGQVDAIDADGNIVQYGSQKVTAGKSGKISIPVPVRINRIHTRLAARILKDAKEPLLVYEHKVPVEHTVELTQYQPLYVAVGQVDGIFITTEFVEQLHVQELKSLAELPENPTCWQGIDSLILNADQLTDSDENLELNRLINWVQAGGHLILLPGIDAKKFVETRIAKRLPVTFEGTAQVRDFSRLVSFVGEPTRIRNRKAISVPRLTKFDGKIVVNSLAGPLITRFAWGFGKVTLVNVDLNHDVIQKWDALPQLYRLLAELPEIGVKQTSGNAKLLTQAGLTDLKTQWDASLSDFQIQTPSVWTPLIYLLLAALLVGPLDYFLVRHLLKRAWLTWITFPILILLLVAWGIFGVDSGRDSNINPKSLQASSPSNSVVRGNQCLVIDYAADAAVQRHFGYLKILCPETGRYDIESEIDLPLKQAETSELFAPGAVPEKSFRGYYRESGMHLDQTAYQVFPAELKSLSTPVYEGSTALLEVTAMQNSNKKNLVKSAANSVLTHQFSSSSTNHLKGSLTYQLEVPISNWVLVYGKIIYSVPEDHPLAVLEKGETIQLPNRSINQKELLAYMTDEVTNAIQRKNGNVGKDYIVSRNSYDPFSKQMNSILRTISFHELVGGQQYTSLTNVEFTSWDFTPLLQLNRAVLIGQIKKPLMKTKVNQQEIQLGKENYYLRLVIPVQQQSIELNRLPDFKEDKENPQTETKPEADPGKPRKSDDF